MKHRLANTLLQVAFGLIVVSWLIGIGFSMVAMHLWVQVFWLFPASFGGYTALRFFFLMPHRLDDNEMEIVQTRTVEAMIHMDQESRMATVVVDGEMHSVVQVPDEIFEAGPKETMRYVMETFRERFGDPE